MKLSKLHGEEFFDAMLRDGLTPEEIINTLENKHSPVFEVDTGHRFIVTAVHNKTTNTVVLTNAMGSPWRAITPNTYTELVETGRILLHSWDMKPITVKTVQ